MMGEGRNSHGFRSIESKFCWYTDKMCKIQTVISKHGNKLCLYVFSSQIDICIDNDKFKQKAAM